MVSLKRTISIPSSHHIMVSFAKQYCLLIWLTNLREMLLPQLDGGPNCHLSIISVSIAWMRCQSIAGLPSVLNSVLL